MCLFQGLHAMGDTFDICSVAVIDIVMPAIANKE